MLAAVAERYGPPEVLRLAEVARPTLRDDEVLVRVRAAAVTAGDARIRAARFPKGLAVPARLALGVTRPRRKVLGGSFSGDVEAIGAGVRGMAVGDRVCAMTGRAMGAHAQYVVVKEGRLARVPPAVGHDDVAGVLFGGTAALWFLRDRAAVGPGASVLVNGASGAVGTNAVQLAHHWGAEVVAVTSPAHAALVTQLGADRVIDYTTHGLDVVNERFDVVLDAVGNLTVRTGRRMVRDGGVLVLAVAGLADMLRARRGVVAGPAPERVADIDTLLGLVAAGGLRVVIDGTYDLRDIVAAHRRVDSGHKAGNVIVHP